MMKCIHLLFNKNNIFINSSNYLMIALFILSIISLFWFVFKNKIEIKKIINQPKKQHTNIGINNNNKNDKTSINNLNNYKKRNKNKKRKRKTKKKLNLIDSSKNNEVKKDEILKYNKDISSLQKTKSKNQFITININNINQNAINNLNVNSKNERNKNEFKQKKNIRNIETHAGTKSQLEPKKMNLKNKKNENKENDNKIFNDTERNEFSFEEALKYDKRSFCEYYLSLLRTKHILIFTFFQNNDYNSKFLKIYIFFFTYYINHTVSAMFYSDKTMSKIYEDDGSFDFTYQLPIMFYSLLICFVLKKVLNILGLYETDILGIKNLKKTNKSVHNEIVKNKLNCIRFKIMFFFIITYILLLFFWIYLGCFCAVYKNTQIHLLIDVSSSFALSFITPLFINLLPGFFRIPSLKNSKSKKGNNRALYKFSKVLQFL